MNNALLKKATIKTHNYRAWSILPKVEVICGTRGDCKKAQWYVGIKSLLFPTTRGGAKHLLELQTHILNSVILDNNGKGAITASYWGHKETLTTNEALNLINEISGCIIQED